MRFLMVTTFFGEHSFGGDAAYVDRLSRALLDQGHEVEVVYNLDAFELTRGDHPPRHYDQPEGLRLHPLQLPAGKWNALWTHQTSLPGTAGRRLRKLLAERQFDVVHCHNISLIGGLGILKLLERSTSAIRLMTAHDHWLTCPLSLLWKLDREVCSKPSCIKCTVVARRPPQLWRFTELRRRALQSLDALIVSTPHTRLAHRQRGVDQSFSIVPYFLPDQLRAAADHAQGLSERDGRPYFAAAGRLIKEKGFESAIAAMRQFPHADLLIAGTGTHELELQRQAADLDNVHFLGLQNYSQLLELYKGARALIVPSKFYETFGFVVLEAFSTKTPVIVSDVGPLPAHIERSGGGFVFSNQAELEAAMQTTLDNPEDARERGRLGHAQLADEWSQARHLSRYHSLIESCLNKRQAVAEAR